MEQNMKTYNYFLYGENDEYGQAQLSEDVKGQIKIAIYTTNKSVQDNVNYHSVNYIGLTNDRKVNDTYVIEYGEERLKVLYTVDAGLRHYNQVFMARV